MVSSFLSDSSNDGMAFTPIRQDGLHPVLQK
jgi:hypothetical protein